MFRLIKGCVVMPLACLALLTLSQPAEGAFTLTLRAGTATTTITDGGAGDTSATSGRIVVENMAVGDYLVTVSTVTSRRGADADPALAQLNLTVERVTRAAGTMSTDPLEIFFQDTGFAVPTDTPLRLVASIASSEPFFPAGGRLENVGEAGNGFGPADAGTVDHATAAAVITSTPDGDETNTVFDNTGSTIDLRGDMVVNLDPGTRFDTFTANVALLAVPEPGSMMVMLSGIGALGLVRLARRRRKQT